MFSFDDVIMCRVNHNQGPLSFFQCYESFFALVNYNFEACTYKTMQNEKRLEDRKTWGEDVAF